MDKLDAAIDALAAAADAVKAGAEGRDFLVGEGGFEGYAQTPLEKALWEAAQGLQRELKSCWRGLDSRRLQRVLEALRDMQPAVGAYHARLISSGGDYDDEFSTGRGTAASLFQWLNQALRRLEAEGSFPLDGVSQPLLVSEFRLPRENDFYFRQALYKHLVSDDMQAVGRPPLSLERAKEAGEGETGLAALKSGAPTARVQAAADLAGLAFTAAPALTERIVSGLADALSDQDDAVARAAAQALESLGITAVPSLLRTLAGPSRPARLLAAASLRDILHKDESGKDRTPWLAGLLDILAEAAKTTT